jgi:opine dehydrogenase
MNQSSPECRKVAVLGGGNGAYVTAAVLSLLGHEVRLLEVPQFADALAAVQRTGRIHLEAPGLAGVPAGEACLAAVTSDPQHALDGAEIVLYVVPAYGEAGFTELCSPYFTPSQLVVYFCGNFGGAMSCAHQLQRNGHASLPLLLETDGLYIGGLKQSATSVRLTGLKTGLDAAALPATRTAEGVQRLNALFPTPVFGHAANVLETGLRNLNPMLHAPISVLNAGRTAPDREAFLYYKEGVTEGVARTIEALDRERREVGSRLGFGLEPLYRVISKWYGWLGAKGETLHELLSTNPAYQTTRAPTGLTHRFLTEDVPFGLVPISAIARVLDVPVPLTEALITLAGTLLDADLRAQGRNLTQLGLAQLTAAELADFARTGQA